LELRRITKGEPYFQGYWVQDVHVGDQLLFRVEHSVAEKEQALLIEPQSAYGILQIDRDLDGKHDLFVVLSVKDQRLTDVLFVTDDGWLRHSTPEEIQARQRIAETNRQAMEELNTTIRDATKKALEDYNK